jgi:hypothetical protein
MPHVWLHGQVSPESLGINCTFTVNSPKRLLRHRWAPLKCIARSGCSAVIRMTTDPRRRADMYDTKLAEPGRVKGEVTRVARGLRSAHARHRDH